MSAALDVLRAEGAASFARRALDRLAEARRRRSFRRAAPHERLSARVLNVLGTEPAARLGGVPIQLVGRLDEEARSRPVALLYPFDGAWRLECETAGRRRFETLPGAVPGEAPVLEDGALADAIGAAADRLGANVVHLEGLHAFPPVSIATLASERPLVLSIHDFAAFCPRPNLVERPAEAFCGFSREPARCARCLGASWRLEPGFQEARRAATGRLLAASRAVVFPSEFLRRAHEELFPETVRERGCVIAPGTPVPPVTLPAGLEAPALRHVAFAGAMKPHKGGLVFLDVVRRLAGAGLRFSAFGGGDPDLLRALRREGVAVEGYYRPGELPTRLRERSVDAALLLSIWPEAYALTLSECRAAGVPVVAFDMGAVGERIQAGGGGLLVPAGEGAEGVATLLRDLAAGRRSLREAGPVPPEALGFAQPAAAHLALYRRLGAGS